MWQFIQKFNSLGFIALVALAISWSWLFQVDVVTLTSVLFIGYLLVFVVYISLVVLSWLIARTAWRRFGVSSTDLKKTTLLKLILVWSASEMLIAFAINLVVMGRGGSWGNFLPFSTLTPLAMMTPLGYLARFTGFFGLSAVVGVGLLLIYFKRWKLGVVYWAILLVFSVGSWLMYKDASGSRITTTIISESVNERVDLEVSDTDFVLFSEYGLDHNELSQGGRLTILDPGTAFSGTSKIPVSGGNSNQLIYGVAGEGVKRSYMKSRLVAFGEYLPIGTELLLNVVNKNVYADFKENREIVRGGAGYPVFRVDDVVIGNAACSSITNPDDYRRLTQNGANLLANSASLEIFNNSGIYGIYHKGFAKFMAVANSRPFIQSANDWEAFALDHNGNSIKSIESNGSTNVNIRTNTKTTPYSLLGEWISILGIAYIVLVTVLTASTRKYVISKINRK